MGDNIKVDQKGVEWDVVVWICLAQGGFQLLAVYRTVISLLVG